MYRFRNINESSKGRDNAYFTQNPTNASKIFPGSHNNLIHLLSKKTQFRCLVHEEITWKMIVWKWPKDCLIRIQDFCHNRKGERGVGILHHDTLYWNGRQEWELLVVSLWRKCRKQSTTATQQRPEEQIQCHSTSSLGHVQFTVYKSPVHRHPTAQHCKNTNKIFLSSEGSTFFGLKKHLKVCIILELINDSIIS